MPPRISVKQQSLYEIAQLPQYLLEGLRLGEGELRSGGFRRPSILADACRSHHRGGRSSMAASKPAQGVIKRPLRAESSTTSIRARSARTPRRCCKEYLQGHKIALPTYTVVATHGAAHNQQFEVECTGAEARL
ncbi:hypothetical protein [Burkholderia multivorans]|uniref:hypothetical protein n=1 Tax=Burkholderia multivorans TaxID=87883 RepID=UPI003BB080B6